MPPVNYRKNLRLPGFDYSQEGAYFITIVTQNRMSVFGWVFGGEMKLNDAGRMVEQVCHEIPQFISGIRMDCYQIMPDHIHMIVEIVGLSGNVGVGVTVGATSVVARDRHGGLSLRMTRRTVRWSNAFRCRTWWRGLNH